MKAIYAGELPEHLETFYLQQHKPANVGSGIAWFFWSETKHYMTDIFTVAIWTIKLKKLPL